MMEDRAVVFYDQLGCGRSDKPDPELGDVYSVASSLRDLRGMLSALGVGPRYHLYGQSWGGLLAAMFVSSEKSLQPLSLTLSNAPTSAALAVSEAGRLIEEGGGSVEDFMATHNCRIDPQPQPLAS